jgi:3-methyladenine DNA glycosylase AlkC
MMKKRVGATTTKAVPADVIAQLNAGTLETANLMEGLVIDLCALAGAAGIVVPPLQSTGIVKRMREVAGHIDDVTLFMRHPSDTVRGFAAFSIGTHPSTSIAEKLTQLQPLAADTHFGVREWAWLGVRDALIADIDAAVAVLLPWSLHADENVRRFASEATRPRGVWCAHIDVLKREPARALPLLEPLRADPSKYVRDSVANWLNDAGKTQPQWVNDVAARWRLESPCAETTSLLSRALRSLR